jgi:glycosyltransferase involved in cell wall biosynthesis
MTAKRTGLVLAIVPTYNECENIERLVKQIRMQPGDIHVLIVDDNSPDGTGKIVDQMALTDPGVMVLHRAGKLGLGTAYKAGFRYGLEQGYQFLCTMDADFSHDPDLIPVLVEKPTLVSTWLWAAAMLKVAWWVVVWDCRLSATARICWLFLLGVTIHDCTAVSLLSRVVSKPLISLDLQRLTFSSKWPIVANRLAFVAAMPSLCQSHRGTSKSASVKSQSLYTSAPAHFGTPRERIDNVVHHWEKSDNR